MNPGPRLFTLAEAEAALPSIRDHLERFQEKYRHFEAVEKDLDVLRLVSASGGEEKNPDLNALARKERQRAAAMDELRLIQQGLLEIGCVPKSIQEGLVDFFALKEGRLVFLCWKMGEEHILAWHTLEGGFAGRRPIETFPAPDDRTAEGPA
jgi:hypothetical protein